MTIRYVRDGLRVVRVAAPPSPAGPDAEAWALEARIHTDLLEAHALVRTAAANMRELARRTRVRRAHALPKGDPGARRTLAEARGVDGPGIVRARKLTGLSQRDLGRLLSYSRGLVAECEHARRNPPPRLTEWAADVLRTEGREP